VEVQGIDPSAPPSQQAAPAPPLATAAPAHAPNIFLQIGAFSDPVNAERVAAQLRVANFAPVEVSDATIAGRLVHRVRVGPLSDVDSADQVSAKIEQMGLPPPQVAVD
jgi:rare lipoprotein A